MNFARLRRSFAGVSLALFVGIFVLAIGTSLNAQDAEIAKKLQGFDAYMAKILKDWNAPGVGVGIVAGDKLVFAKGYGYRDYGKKLPFTPTTLCQIASNTKLFTAIASGILVGRRQADLGQAGPRIGSDDPVL